MPFIARWKGRIQEGKVDTKSVISAVDLLPTFASLAGVSLPKEYEPDGEDISDDLISGTTHTRNKSLYWEWRFDGVGQWFNRSPMLAVRDGDWKLLFNPDSSRVELYNIPNQPMELHSIADKYPDVVERLWKKAIQWQSDLPKGPVTTKPGSDEYPGFPENAGRGPIMNDAEYQKMIKPMRITITEKDAQND